MELKLNTGAFESEVRAGSLDAQKIYDVLIVGGGPAALTAAVYCMRKGVSTGLVTMDFGGQVAETAAVENYMGYKYIEGIDLVQRFRDQVRQFEIGISDGTRAVSIADGAIKKVSLEDGSVLQAKSLIITTGKSWRKLGIPGERELTGRGVAYCAICDAPLFAGKNVIVVGGGNTGVEAAIDLAKIASRVSIVQFLENLTADKILVDKIGDFKNVDILYEHELTEIKGVQAVEAATVRNRKTGDTRELPVQGVFIEVGLIPNTELVRGVVDLNESGEIVVDSACRTSAAGIFAAGDVTTVPFKQIIIAAGEGAKAALSACEYVLRGN